MGLFWGSVPLLAFGEGTRREAKENPHGGVPYLENNHDKSTWAALTISLALQPGLPPCCSSRLRSGRFWNPGWFLSCWLRPHPSLGGWCHTRVDGFGLVCVRSNMRTCRAFLRVELARMVGVVRREGLLLTPGPLQDVKRSSAFLRAFSVRSVDWSLKQTARGAVSQRHQRPCVSKKVSE